MPLKTINAINNSKIKKCFGYHKKIPCTIMYARSSSIEKIFKFKNQKIFKFENGSTFSRVHQSPQQLPCSRFREHCCPVVRNAPIC